MPLAPVLRYVGRWNATLRRREWRRPGLPSLVVGGGTIKPGALTVALAAAPISADAGATVSLSTSVSGGTAPYAYVWTAPTGITLSGTGASRTFVAPDVTTSYTIRVSVKDSSSPQLTQEASAVVSVAGDTAGALFAGHVPNRVLVGMATPEEGSNVNPGWTEARQLIGQSIYEARRFKGVNYSLSVFNGMLAEADAASAYPVISLKYGNWLAASTGANNADYEQIWARAVARRTAGPNGTPKPFALSIHHEPAGDGSLSDWAKMQIHMSWYFGGRRGGTPTSTYVREHDVRDIMAIAPIGNGFWWRTTGNPAAGADANLAFPQALVDALRINKGILMADFYDTDYVNQTLALTDKRYRTAGAGVRTWKRIENFLTWARAKNTGAVGCGEFGVIDGPEMKRCADIMIANRDIWAISNQFNSNNNSDHEWRIIPSTYPAGNPVGSKGLVDFGGDAQSQGRLDEFKAFLTRSTSAAGTGPVSN